MPHATIWLNPPDAVSRSIAAQRLLTARPGISILTGSMLLLAVNVRVWTFCLVDSKPVRLSWGSDRFVVSTAHQAEVLMVPCDSHEQRLHYVISPSWDLYLVYMSVYDTG